MCVYRKLSRNEDNNMNICESMTLDKTEKIILHMALTIFKCKTLSCDINKTEGNKHMMF